MRGQWTYGRRGRATHPDSHALNACRANAVLDTYANPNPDSPANAVLDTCANRDSRPNPHTHSNPDTLSYPSPWRAGA